MLFLPDQQEKKLFSSANQMMGGALHQAETWKTYFVLHISWESLFFFLIKKKLERQIKKETFFEKMLKADRLEMC